MKIVINISLDNAVFDPPEAEVGDPGYKEVKAAEENDNEEFGITKEYRDRLRALAERQNTGVDQLKCDIHPDAFGEGGCKEPRIPGFRFCAKHHAQGLKAALR